MVDVLNVVRVNGVRCKLAMKDQGISAYLSAIRTVVQPDAGRRAPCDSCAGQLACLDGKFEVQMDRELGKREP
jgi:hypothetical protein